MLVILLSQCTPNQEKAVSNLSINKKGYFEKQGLNVTVFSDIYPEGHQTGVSIIQHGLRVAANGDLRLEPSPGQWSPVPKGGKMTVDTINGVITQELWYPDSSKNGKGFNPVFYPDLIIKYKVNVEALEGNSFQVTVDLEEPLPDEWVGKVGFNFELFPQHLFGKSYMMDNNSGTFVPQPSGPVEEIFDENLTIPLATGTKLVIAPEEDLQRILIESKSGNLELWDGRSNHNNGWYIVRTEVKPNTTDTAIEWVITPNVVPNWVYKPVIQVSQLGYHPDQPKQVVIEQDLRDQSMDEVSIYRLTDTGRQKVSSGTPVTWGEFLRYNYLTYDFSGIIEPGMYVVGYRDQFTQAFKIGGDVYSRNAWQPTMDYYLPVQMCHMRINEKYRVWHDFCHLDDALMAPLDTNHFDGYRQGSSTLSRFKPYDAVPGINVGGWHDAGDYDLRVESQVGTLWMLALMIEEFGLNYDATSIDQQSRIVEIHQPDGKSDAIQQIEHGLLSVLGGYRSMGRLFRGIICNDLRQYVMLGDASSMTDNVVDPGNPKADDRWVFTEENPNRALNVAAGLAAASRVLKASNPRLSAECLEVAKSLYQMESPNARRAGSKIIPLSELILATEDPVYIAEFISMKEDIINGLRFSAWAVGHVIDKIPDEAFKSEIAEAVAAYTKTLKENSKTDSPYGVPYTPNIWGAGWNIQRFGVDQYFVNKGWPEHGSKDLYLNALQFILGVHPGENTSSFASGVGSRSVLTAYGVNRGDWSYIPGGVASGTALIRPDLPELKIWPFFWQQTEYVMGGGATNYMFLVLAAENLYQ
ncbi:MAG: glycoside hydrolase family 9 protein [Bacteroidetes bacterium]|nr:glycoside hydrolase family 9 protein [Bacteroidota bacterium]MDA1120515.1 glycoside hydrolase family 9 protein [Bacteroidota bacterium]